MLYKRASIPQWNHYVTNGTFVNNNNSDGDRSDEDSDNNDDDGAQKTNDDDSWPHLGYVGAAGPYETEKRQSEPVLTLSLNRGSEFPPALLTTSQLGQP